MELRGHITSHFWLWKDFVIFCVYFTLNPSDLTLSYGKLLSISLYYIVTSISLFLFWFQYYFIIQISEASEEGSLDRNPELMESDEE